MHVKKIFQGIVVFELSKFSPTIYTFVNQLLWYNCVVLKYYFTLIRINNDLFHYLRNGT